MIEWKIWKENPDYDIHLNDAYLETKYSLQDAKNFADAYLIQKREELSIF